MPSVADDVELIKQEQNPICWVASCAMVKGYGTKTSVGVGEFTGGFDPSNSCIANLAGSWTECTDMIAGWGFTVLNVKDVAPGGITAATLLSTIQNKGPAVLLHMCVGFPYGSQWASVKLKATDAHAVVITGVDTDKGTATFNNPWGDKDQSCSLATLVQKINADQVKGKTLAFWPMVAQPTSQSPSTSGGQSGADPQAGQSSSSSPDASTTPDSSGSQGQSTSPDTSNSPDTSSTPDSSGSTSSSSAPESIASADPSQSQDPAGGADPSPATSSTPDTSSAQDPAPASDPANTPDTSASPDTSTPDDPPAS